MSAPTLGPLSPPAPPDGLPVPRRYWAIVAIVLAIAMSVLDSTIVNVALPTIARDFRVSAAASIWVINAYQLAILVVLLPLAALGERVGYRRVSQIGLIVFTVASLGCALAPGLLSLSIARVIQGFGAGAIMSVNPALVRFTYPQRSLAIRALPESERRGQPLDYAGMLLYAATVALLLSGLQSLAHNAATPLALAQLGCALGLGWLLVRHELPRATPVVPFDLLRIRLVSLSLATAVCAFTAQMTAFVALPFEIQRLGHSAVETGLYMTPWPLALALAAPLAGRLADRHAAGILGGLGLAMMAAGLMLLAFFPAGGSAAGFVWRMALCGAGFGFFQAPNNRTLISSAPRVRSGAAGGMLSGARLLGQAIGAAGVAILFRFSPAAGSNFALRVAALLALGAAGISVVRLTGQPARQDATEDP